MKKLLKLAKWIFLPIIFLVLIILIPIGINKVYHKVRSTTLTQQEKFSEDIERLEYIMKNEFAGYGVLKTSASFDNELKQLKEKVDQNTFTSQTDFNLSIIKAVSSFKDPHTAVYNKSVFLDKRFPYYLDWSDGNFYLLSGQVEKKWLGAKVSKIGKNSNQDVFKKLSAYTNSPNEAGTAIFMRSALYSPDILYKEGIIENPEEVTLEVELNGEKTTLSFSSMSRAAFAALSDYYRIAEKFNKEELPLFMTNRNQNYWYKSIEDKNVLYVRYNMCVSQGDIESFWDRVFSKLEETNPEKLIIDVRGNPGGDTQNHSSFLNRLQKNTSINQYGKLYTFIDRGTGSAAVSFANDMEKMTNAILVGEQTMDKPNTTSDPTFYTLPHAGITILVPSLYSLHSYVADERNAIYPQMPITQKLMGNNYLTDEVMDSVINLKATIENLEFAKIPSSMQGQYSFSQIRNASLTLKDSIWYFSIDGLIEAPVYKQDSTVFTKKYNIIFSDFDSLSKSLNLTLHGTNMKLDRIGADEISLEKSINNRNFSVTKTQLAEIQKDGDLPYFLDRPFFQQRIYHLYNEYGFSEAMALNQINKEYYPSDPVVSIIDFELNEYEGNTLGKTKAVFPIFGKLLNRYYTVITTNKLMNDDYNAFIGK